MFARNLLKQARHIPWIFVSQTNPHCLFDFGSLELQAVQWFAFREARSLFLRPSQKVFLSDIEQISVSK